VDGYQAKRDIETRHHVMPPILGVALNFREKVGRARGKIVLTVA
jgi:hypothetical protein